MNQNKTSSATENTTETKKASEASVFLPPPSFMKCLGFASMKEIPGLNPPVFSADPTKACRPKGWTPEPAPAFLEGINLIRGISKVRLYMSGDPEDFYVTAPGGGSILEYTKPDGSPMRCVITEVPGTETNDFFEGDWEALRNPALRATTDIELLMDSIEMGRMAFKTMEDGDEIYFVMIEREGM